LIGDAAAILLRPERRYIVLRKPIEWTDMKQQQTARRGPTERSTTGVSARGPAPTRRSTGRTQDIDRHVGARVRERRIMLGLTQQQLADLIGVTYQQAHKYERGINRVSAGRL
jgi:DNA-binding XRE family transcriptional regulator